jgi:4-hydroxy-3-polyprenylbenzoate decarboxylase
MDREKPIILAITAASGIIYGIRTLEFLLKEDYKVELIISANAYHIAKQELNLEIEHKSNNIKSNILSFINLLDKNENLKVYLNDELWAGPASGSYQTSGMIIAPCSMATLAAISTGYAESLITRAADVIIKERKNLVIVPRETPLSSIHLENMLKLSNLGVRIVPPIVGFYGKIQSVDDCINFVIGKVLDASNIPNELYKRWHI